MTRKTFDAMMRAAGKATAKAMRGVEAPRAGPTPIVVEFYPIELGALDVWIADQPEPRPSRAEAIRRLVAESLVRM